VEGEAELEVTFKIRKASAEDAEAIIEVLDHVPFLKDRYRGEAGISLVENNLDMIWLADLGGRVASVMVLRKDLGRLEISLIVTKPEFRRRDFARGLIHKAKRIAADSEVELVAHTENDISRDLFISEQFSLVPEVQSVEGHPMYRFSGKQIEPR
jgi:ribosomal protein S18 acetylase RimI-like enzyme